WGGGVIPTVLAIVAAVYYAGVWAEGRKAGTAARFLPAPVAYFTQVAALFPGAAQSATDYPVEVYRCKDRAWTEIDASPWSPIEADNKENRFYRAIHFYGDEHPHRQTLQALDEYIVTHFNADAIDAAAQGRGGEEVGGVRFARLHVPFGNPGD